MQEFSDTDSIALHSKITVFLLLCAAKTLTNWDLTQSVFYFLLLSCCWLAPPWTDFVFPDFSGIFITQVWQTCHLVRQVPSAKTCFCKKNGRSKVSFITHSRQAAHSAFIVIYSTNSFRTTTTFYTSLLLFKTLSFTVWPWRLAAVVVVWHNPVVICHQPHISPARFVDWPLVKLFTAMNQLALTRTAY